MSRNTKAEMMIKAKFVVNQLMGIICDASGKSVNTEAVDNVFEDIFGYKRLASKLDCTRDDIGMLSILSDFGLNDIFSICNDVKVMDVIADLVIMDLQMHKLHKVLKRADKKGEKRPKNKVKDYKYVSQLYEKTVKVLRKQLGYSSKMSLKSSFNSAKALVTGYSREGRSYFESQYYGDDEDYYDDDDDEVVTPYDEYLRSIRRKKPKSHVHERFEQLPGQNPAASRMVFKMKPRHSMQIPLDDLMDDDDDDEDDGGDVLLERYDDRTGDANINRKLDVLISTMERMVNLVAAPAARLEVDRIDPDEFKVRSTGNDSSELQTEATIDAGVIKKINANETKLAKAIEAITKMVGAQNEKLEQTQQTLYAVIKYLAIDDDDDEDEEGDDEDDDDDQRGMRGMFAERPMSRDRNRLAGGPRHLSRADLISQFNEDAMTIPPEADARLRYGELSPGFRIREEGEVIPDFAAGTEFGRMKREREAAAAANKEKDAETTVTKVETSVETETTVETTIEE